MPFTSTFFAFTFFALCSFSFLIFELAVFEDAAYGRLGFRSDFHQIELLFTRDIERVADAHNAKIRAIGADHAHFGRPDGLIRAELKTDIMLLRFSASVMNSHWCI